MKMALLAGIALNLPEVAAPSRRREPVHRLTARAVLPKNIDEIEALTGRSFHSESATITASLGEERSTTLEGAARAWLLARG